MYIFHDKNYYFKHIFLFHTVFLAPGHFKSLFRALLSFIILDLIWNFILNPKMLFFCGVMFLNKKYILIPVLKKIEMRVDEWPFPRDKKNGTVERFVLLLRELRKI